MLHRRLDAERAEQALDERVAVDGVAPAPGAPSRRRTGGLPLLNHSASRLPVSAVNIELKPVRPALIWSTTSGCGCG